jgi:hypothetical protein
LIRIFLIVSLINGWHSRQLDFVLAYPQADMAIPAGFSVNGNQKDYVLKLRKNLYGQKQAGRVWNQHLHAGLTEKLGFIQSEVDPCVYYRGTLIFLLYTDNSILISLNNSEIDHAVEELSKHFIITDQGQIDDYLGV